MKPRSSMDNIMGGITRCWFADPVDSGGGSAGAVVAESPLGAMSADYYGAGGIIMPFTRGIGGDDDDIIFSNCSLELKE